MRACRRFDDESVTQERTNGPRIVVGTDGSDHAARALRWAAEETGWRQVTLEVVHAWLPAYPVTAHDLFNDYAPLEKASRAVLAAAIDRVRGEVPQVGEIHETLLMEQPALALMHAARGAEMLVVGSRGRGGFAGLLLGSVSQRCITHAPCPVVVVPADCPTVHRGRIVVGVDGSPASHHALVWAAHEASSRKARLEVVNAWSVPEILVPGGLAFNGDADALDQASRSLLKQMTDSIGDDLDVEPPEMDLQSVAERPARALIEAARDADLLVVGSRGLGGFRGALLGSVSQQCAHHAPCPTAVVHRPNAQTEDDP